MHRQARQQLGDHESGRPADAGQAGRHLAPERSNQVSSFLNLRVADIQACYRDWSARGAEFLTEPLDRGAEVRCYMRDPDGYLIEVGQSTGLLVGKQAEIRPEDLPADG
jgi:catechol 2,3-dioxygenase-like lactoylglutathione lyase family enzyme